MRARAKLAETRGNYAPKVMPCECDKPALWHRWGDRSLSMWDLLECTACGLVVTRIDMRESLKRWQREHYERYLWAEQNRLEQERRAQEMELSAWLAKRVRHGG